MLALLFHEYGDPDVLQVGEAPEPHTGPGQVRIAVRAASVNPFDWKVRAGYLAEYVPMDFPGIPGTDAAGVVDEVGEGVQDVAVGDEVFGLGSQTSAEYAVLGQFAAKPPALSWEEAAAIGLATETAARGLDLLGAGVGPGTTLLVDGAAGGVGSAATQLAVARGAAVIGTASPGNHDYLAGLGAQPTTYGPGLAQRVAELAPGGVDAALDVAGQGSVPDLIAITGNAERVVSIADSSAAEHGALFAAGAGPRAGYALAEAARLHAEGRFVVPVAQVFPLAAGADAHRLSQGGHVRGKLVLTVP